MTSLAERRSENGFSGRERSRLRRARESGYLNAAGSRDKVVEAHSFWCWRMRVPLVWYDRKSARSRFGRLHLELHMTPYALTANGMVELEGAAARCGIRPQVRISDRDAIWEDVPLPQIESLARTVFRIVLRVGNYDLERRLRIADRQPVTNVLEWRIPA